MDGCLFGEKLLPSRSTDYESDKHYICISYLLEVGFFHAMFNTIDNYSRFLRIYRTKAINSSQKKGTVDYTLIDNNVTANGTRRRDKRYATTAREKP